MYTADTHHAPHPIDTKTDADREGGLAVEPSRAGNGEADLVGETQQFKDLLRRTEMVAPTGCTTLIEGETGTGKERVAERIHRLSPRRNNAFVKLNCAAIPLGLLESELFGHERGAFTGAIAQRAGRFETANGGTLFLDEVGDIPPELQPKLLRVLQDGQFERLGSTRTIQVDVRLIAATHRNLARMVEDGQFRADLFYRLSVFPIAVPPLRERGHDIPGLVLHFVFQYARVMNKRIETVPAATMEALARYSWPGNIRELQNFVERSVILSRGPALEAPLNDLCVHGVPVEPVTLHDAERAHILRTLQKTNGQLAGAAVLLGVPRSTLFYMIRRLGISQQRIPDRLTAGAC
jgi:formate hydrogenlyase transcriptional activator